MFERFLHPRFLTRALAVALFVGMIGAFKPVLFNDGSSMAKYVAKQSQLEMVGEQEAEAYFEAILYGEGEVPPVPTQAVPEAERRKFVETVFRADRWIAIALGLGALLLLVPALLERSVIQHLLPILSLWLIVEAVAVTLNGGKAHSDLTVLAHATRWGLPLILWGMVRRSRSQLEAPLETSALVHVAVAFTALTFAVHGWEALTLSPLFQDLIHGFVALFNGKLSPAAIASCLRLIGCMDLILAGTILIYRRPWIFLWMACWGLITALSRPLAMGVEAWPEVAMRMANMAMPFLLYLIYHKPKHRSAQASETQTADENA